MVSRMKTIWKIAIEDVPQQWFFASYDAVVKTMEKTYGITDLPPSNQVTDKTRIGRQVDKLGWVQITALPLHESAIDLEKSIL